MKCNYGQAITDYSKTIELNPQFAKAYYDRGNVRFNNKGSYDEMIGDYTIAMELNPQYAEAYGNRGLVYRKSGHFQKSTDDFHSYLKIAGNREGKASEVRQWISEMGFISEY